MTQMSTSDHFAFYSTAVPALVLVRIWRSTNFFHTARESRPRIFRIFVSIYYKHGNAFAAALSLDGCEASQKKVKPTTHLYPTYSKVLERVSYPTKRYIYIQSTTRFATVLSRIVRETS